MWGQLWGPWYPLEILGQKMTFCLAGLCSYPLTTINSRNFEILRLARQE